MTEDEARKKWCPMVRYVPNRPFSFGRIVAAVNRWIDDEDTQLSPDPCQCIASDCACWVWDTEKDYETVQGNIIKAAGHCGLINR